jgi:hypothetical protein
MVLGAIPDEQRYRSLAEKYDWRIISKIYEKVLEGASI